MAVGETLGVPDKLPGTHKKLVPPVALNTVEPPIQTLAGDADATTGGELIMESVTVLVLVHPLALVAVTV